MVVHSAVTFLIKFNIFALFLFKRLTVTLLYVCREDLTSLKQLFPLLGSCCTIKVNVIAESALLSITSPICIRHLKKLQIWPDLIRHTYRNFCWSWVVHTVLVCFFIYLFFLVFFSATANHLWVKMNWTECSAVWTFFFLPNLPPPSSSLPGKGFLFTLVHSLSLSLSLLPS